MGHKMRETMVVGLLGAGVFGVTGATLGLVADGLHGNFTSAEMGSGISTRAQEAAVDLAQDETRLVELGGEIENVHQQLGAACWNALQVYSNNGELAGSTEDQIVSDFLARSDRPCEGNVTEIRSDIRPWAQAQHATADIQSTIGEKQELARVLEAERKADSDFDAWYVGLEIFFPIGSLWGILRRKKLLSYRGIAELAGVKDE